MGNLLSNRIIEGNINALDFQFNTIEQIFLGHKERILAAPNRISEATQVM